MYLNNLMKRLFGVSVLTLGMLLCCQSSGWSDTTTQKTPEERAKQIAELEKQIKSLQESLKNLKEQETKPQTKEAPVEGLPVSWVRPMTWRVIGPPNMGGRITSIAVNETDPSMYWVATASGGLLKTVNNGSTFEHQFDKETTVSIGAVAVAPSNPDIVWVGTGEANPRNSVSYGDGVYKSVDGGKTWKNMGLKKSYQTGALVIHPKNPDIVYVGSLGRLYGPHEERGLFKTTDGGATWQKILYIDDKTGVMDIAMHPTDPETLIVATWERQRDEFDSFLGDSLKQKPEAADGYAPVKTHGTGSGLYKTTNGGKNFTKLSKGLPTAKMGRIGLCYSRQNPNNVYAIIDTEEAGKGIPPSNVYLGIQGENTTGGAKLTVITEGGPAEKAGLKVGDVVTNFNTKEVKDYVGLTELIRATKAGDKVKVQVLRGSEKKELEVTVAARESGRRPGGGGTGSRQRPDIGIDIEEAEGGLLITEVIEKGPAAKAGLKAKDLITAIDGKAIEGGRRGLLTIFFTKSVGDKIKITYTRDKQKKDVEVTLEAALPNRPGAGGSPNRPYAGPAGLGGQAANVQDQQGPDGWNTGGIYKSTDNGESWTRINSTNPRPFYFSVVKIDPTDENIQWVLGVDLTVSTNGGKTFSNEFNGKDRYGKTVRYPCDRGVHSDHHAMWINPKDGRHIILGTDGGFYITYDRGAHWEHLNHFALGQFYHVTTDNRKPYRVYGGLQDNGSWGGPSQTLRGTGPSNEDFITIGGGDGFVCRVDALNPDIVYSESQNGAMGRRNLKTGQQNPIRPRSVPGASAYRFNWNTPFILSHHNPLIFYCAGNYVHKSVKQGDELKMISPEITRTKRGSATALAESPKNPDILWVGTDDGAVWNTKDGGKTWNNLTDKFTAAGMLPGPRWVASIETSKAVEGRAYVCFDAHRSNDDEPYVYVTEDYGQTWKSIRANLPTGSTRVLREDIVNPNLLYCGTEFACYASIDQGASWTKLNGTTLPTVAVHEFAQPTTANEIVAATHGRSLWILDVTSLRQLKPELLKGSTTLLAPATVTRWQTQSGRGGMFNTPTRKFVGQNAPQVAHLDYILAKKPSKFSMKVVDINGKTVTELRPAAEGGLEPGFHRISWNMRRAPQIQPGGATPEQLELAGLRGFAGPDISVGTYRIVMNVDGEEFSQTLVIEADPNNPRTGAAISDEDETNEEAEKEAAKKQPAKIDD